MGASQRRKGASFERKVANFLQHIWPSSKRGIGQARSAGEVADVEGTPYHFELKTGKNPRIKAALEQAEAATKGRPCVVIAHWDGQPLEESIVACRLRDLVAVWKEAE